MGEKTLTRRDLVKLAKNGAVATAGLGFMQMAKAAESDPLVVELMESTDGSIAISQAMSNRLKQLGIKNGGYGIIIFKFNDIIISSSHALPLEGNMSAATSDDSSRLSLKVTGKRNKVIAQTQGALLEFQIPEK